MPIRAPSICGCGRLVPSGQRCACRVIADRERNRAIDVKRGSARDRGYDRNWERERAAFLRADPLCRQCLAPAAVVDHIGPHRGNMQMFWDRSNWQSLCVHCHSSWKQKIECREAAR